MTVAATDQIDPNRPIALVTGVGRRAGIGAAVAPDLATNGCGRSFAVETDLGDADGQIHA